ncbi:MAG: hypothetical protein M1829_005117 [Trizodia sp. TS-e1964]|nr:MAG: hypothetical protein M1829_005117 [Trizodia sp. TS-e1964]
MNEEVPQSPVLLMAPLTAAELVKHNAYQNVTWDLKPVSKDKALVAKGRGGPLNIAYEVHGNGPLHLVVQFLQKHHVPAMPKARPKSIAIGEAWHKLVADFLSLSQWIMGLGSFQSAWQRQTRYFGHENASKYSSLIFDNRGMGQSDKPFSRYSTSDMAKDAIELLDQLGWTEKRQLHVIGTSLGGMISQEIVVPPGILYVQKSSLPHIQAMLIPERLASLSLMSTAARLVNTTGFFENLLNRINLFIPKEIDTQLASSKLNLFPEDWLAAPDIYGEFPSNGDRIAAGELKKRSDTLGFTRKGFILQAIAAGWHNKSPAQLKELAERVGRRRIQVAHGGMDRMIPPVHGEVLVEGLSAADEEVRMTRFPRQGHVLLVEVCPEFNKLIEDFVAETEALNRAEV